MVGIPEEYYSAVIGAESGGNPNARNPNSTATGIAQFTAGTWREMMRRHPELGLTEDGRTDPDQSMRALRAFTEDNARLLNAAGIPIDGGSLYAAHFLGAGGARSVLGRSDDEMVADIVGEAVVSANPFLRGMTVGQFRNWAARKGHGTGASGVQYGNTAVEMPVTTDPDAIHRTYTAYVRGQMTPEEARAYEADVRSGRMPVPSGMSLYEPFQADPDTIARTYAAYLNGGMSPEDAAAYEADVRTGFMPVPPGVGVNMGQIGPVRPQARPDQPSEAAMLPRADDAYYAGEVFDQEPAPPSGDRPFFDIARATAAEGGGDLASMAFGSLMNTGPELGQAMIGDVPVLNSLGESVLGGAIDVGLGALGAMGAGAGFLAGAAGDVAEGLGMSPSRSRQLAGDLMAMPEAFAGSPGVLPRATRLPREATAPRTVPDMQGPTAPPHLAPMERLPVTNAPLGEQQTNDMRRIIARAANNDRRARAELAALAQVDPEALAAARRLGIDLPTDVFANNAAVQQAAGIVRAVRSNDAAVEWENSYRLAQQRASDILEAEGGSRDLAAAADRVQNQLTTSIETLRTEAGVLYDEVAAAVPSGVRVRPDASTRLLNQTLEELGSDPSRLSRAERQLYDAITAPGGMTYAALDRERRLIGRALGARPEGPYADADTALLNRIYRALQEDQRAFIAAEAGDDVARTWDQARDLWSSAKDLEGSLVAGFGRDLNGSIANTLRSAVTNAGRGDAARLNRILDVVPEDLQRETLLTAIDALSQARSAQGGFSFAEYTKLYRGLRDNSPIYSRIAGVLGTDTANVMRDLYEVSIRIDRAAGNVPRTGMANQALIAESLMSNVLNSTTGRYVRGMAAGGAAGAATGNPMVGGIAAVAAQSGKVGRDRMQAVGHLFRNEAFQNLMVEAATTGRASDATVDAVVRAPAFRRWANAAGIQNPEQWLLGALAATSAPNVEETAQ